MLKTAPRLSSKVDGGIFAFAVVVVAAAVVVSADVDWVPGGVERTSTDGYRPSMSIVRWPAGAELWSTRRSSCSRCTCTVSSIVFWPLMVKVE